MLFSDQIFELEQFQTFYHVSGCPFPSLVSWCDVQPPQALDQAGQTEAKYRHENNCDDALFDFCSMRPREPIVVLMIQKIRSEKSI